MNVEPYVEWLRPRIANKGFVVAFGPLAAATPIVRQLRNLGSERLLVLGHGVGIGDLPSDADADLIDVTDGAVESDIMAAIRTYERLLLDPPRPTIAALERYDPDRSAQVVAAHYLQLEAIVERPRFGKRLPAWVEYEDKTVIDPFWSRAGVVHAEARVVPAKAAALRAAARQVDRGDGSVWSGDARDGVHGGATYVRVITSEEDIASSVPFFESNCDRVRVMPYLLGVPCSIHGVVFSDDVIAFRPVEMLCPRRAGSSRFLYAGSATYFDPSPATRAGMGAMARKVGATLRSEVDYRGGFTIDGVATRDGFRPTELNARAGAALELIGSTLPNLPLRLLIDAVASGAPIDFDPNKLRKGVVAAADATRVGSSYAIDPTLIVSEGRELRVARREQGQVREVAADEEADGVVTLGTSPVGAMVRFIPDARRIRPGPPLGPLVAAVLQYCDEVFGTRFGPLEAARVAE